MKRLLALLMAAAPLAAMAAEMKPGSWEYTMKMEMPGMPVAMPPQVTTQCLKQADVDKGQAAAVPNAQSSGCEVKNFKQSGNKVSYDMACPDSTSHAEFTTTATTMEGLTTTDMGGNKMTMRMTAKRVGDCK